jgi:CheY-like chemotaxis protein
MTDRPRRQYSHRRPRRKVSWPVTVEVGTRLLHGETRDVSAFGIKIRLEEPLPDAAIVTLHLEPTHGDPWDAQAILWRTDDDGLVFFFLNNRSEVLAQASSTPSPASRVSSIVVVDDDPDVGAFVQSALESEGYLVRVTADPHEAIRMAKRGSSEVDLLLVDVVMPLMDGRELVHRMRTLRPNLKVMFMSGYEMAGLRDMGWPIISKPFGLAELTEKVAEAMSSSRSPSAFAAPRPGARRPNATARAT